MARRLRLLAGPLAIASSAASAQAIDVATGRAGADRFVPSVRGDRSADAIGRVSRIPMLDAGYRPRFLTVAGSVAASMREEQRRRGPPPPGPPPAPPSPPPAMAQRGPSLPPSETLPAGFEPVAEYVGALFIGNAERADGVLAEDVEVSVSDGERTLYSARGRVPARAMHAAMTGEGRLGVENFSCRPEGRRARCDVIFAGDSGAGEVTRRHFTLRFETARGRIIRLLSWENH